MSSEVGSIILMCDNHTNDVAQALCHFHKKLLCLSCVFEKAKSPECSFTEIQKVSGDKDTLFLELLSVRQEATKKERLIQEHENNTRTLKTKLDQCVIDMHGTLAKRLDEMKETCLTSINNQAESLTAANTNNKQRLDTLKATLNEHIDKLSAASVNDVLELQTKLNVMKTEIIQEIPDKDTVPEGEFTRNKRLEDFFLQSGTSLGNVYMIDPRRYDKIDETPDLSSVPVYSSSDEIVYATEEKTTIPTEYVANTKIIDSVEKRTENLRGQRSSDISDKSENKSPGGKSEKKSTGIFKWKWFSSDKKAGKGNKSDTQNDHKEKPKVQRKPSSEGAEDIYQDSTFYTPTYVSPKYLINKTVNASVLKQYFPSPCKFSKLVDLGDGYIGMLSESHNSLVLVRTGGQVLGKKTIKAEKIAMSAAGNKEVAVIVEPGLQVSKYKVSENGFSTAGGFVVSEEISKITGFDFDDTLLQFAISSQDKLIILDKSGKKLNVVTYGNTKTTMSTEITTAYDFNCDCLCTLNIINKTFKMYSFKKSKVLWKRKFEEDSVTPRSMVLYNDKLCIVGGDGIAIFSTIYGEPIIKHDTQDLLDDCLATCVIDDVFVLSSNSDNFEKSMTLAYISL